MKDKLVKYHHKAVYFYFKKVGICFSIFAGASILVAVPVSIAATIRANEVSQSEKANENKTEARVFADDLFVF